MHVIRKIGILCILSAMVLLFTISTVIAEPDKGTGIVRIYYDALHNNELTPSTEYDGQPHYLLGVGETYYFVINGISEYGDSVTQLGIKIGYTDTSGKATAFIGPVLLSDGSVEFSWTIPTTAVICTTGTVHYYNPDPNAPKPNPDYLAHNPFTTIPSVFHVIPENYLGPIGALGAGILAMVAFATIKRHSIRSPICNRFN
jgi:hypothetical protein